MNQPLRRLAAVLFVAFALLILDVTYLQVVAGPRYRDDARNPRVVASRTGKERGLILSADRQILALGRVPEIDLFSFWRPEPQPWNNYEWAYDWATWLVYDHLGASALILLKCFALGALGYLLVRLADRLARVDDVQKSPLFWI